MGARISYWGRQTPEEQMESDRRARDSLPLFEEAGDAEGAAMAWTLIGDFAWSRCQATEAGHAWRRATDLFRQAGNRWMAAEELSWLSSVAVWGPTPCDEAMRALESMNEEAHGSPVAALEISSSIGVILMMQGALDEARDRILANDLRMRELGRSLPLAHASQQIGFLELLSGRAAEAERILGDGARALDAMGSHAVGIVSAFHAQALYALGRLEEADGAGAKAIREGGLGISERVMGLGVRAMVAARRGAFDEAERLASEALTIIDVTDFPCDRADARVALAEVLELAGRSEDAIRVADEALELFHTKGNVTQAADVRARLERLHGGG
jgi:tetratricopeptide (TPR) repeat protein